MSLLFGVDREKIYGTYKCSIIHEMCPEKAKVHGTPRTCATQACLQQKPSESWEQAKQGIYWLVAYSRRKLKYAFLLYYWLLKMTCE